MEEYMKAVLQATGEAWAVFKGSALTHKNPKLAFEQLRTKYKGTAAENYVNKYTEICEEELPNIKDAEVYMAEAKNVGNKVFYVFKKCAEKVFTEEMADNDWNMVIKMSSDVGYAKWNPMVKNYAQRYSAMIAWELDRQYQKLHNIKEDWYKYI